MTDVLRLTAAVDLQAAAGAGAKRVEIVAYTGAEIQPNGFGNVVIDVSGLKLSPQTPLIVDHETVLGSIIGYGTASLEAGNVIVRGSIVDATEAAKQVLQLAKSGFQFQASVGVAPGERQIVRAGETIQANGRTFKAGAGGLLLLKSGTLKEVSILALGADSNTAVSIAARGKKMPTENTADPVQAERDRLKKIDTLTAGRWRDPSHPDHGRIEAAREKAIDGGSIEELQASVIDILRTSGGSDPWASRELTARQSDLAARYESKIPLAHTVMPSNHHNTSPDVLQASLCLSAGCDEKFVGEQFDEPTMNAALSRPYRDFGLHGLLFATIRAAGKHVDGHRVTSDTIRTAFEADRMLRAQGFSAVSVPGILSSAAGKILLEAYQALPQTWQVFCSVSSVDDFKSHSRYRLTSTGDFEQVAPAGQIKHATLAEQSYSQQASTYGAMLAITRQDIINDDLAAFAQIPRILGRMSAVKVEKVAYTLLLANTGSFFASGNNNYFEGAGTTLQISQLAVAEQTLIDQVDANGDPVMIVPQTLLAPSTLKTTAWSLCSSTELVGSTTADVLKPSGNPFFNRLTPVASPWLNAGVLTGGSDVAWYLFGNPADVACFEMAFLRGNRFPTIETADTDFNTLGIQMRAYHDFGVCQLDPRGGCKSKGAA